MGLSFLVPAFFAALAALAIPILVHLTHRSRREVVRFPSLRFLDQVPYRAVRRQRIRHWPLFLARCLALVLLALAFARPLLDRVGGVGGAGAGGTETVLLIDRSYSMGYGDHWQRAVAAARAVTDAVGPEDRASVVTFAEDASLAVEGTSDPTVLRLALDSLTPGAGRTRFAPALQVARQLLDQSRLPNRNVVLISDFQNQG
ncbi:MAG: VWA domain-containing protein [Gemmatimonadales bacterium]|nr:VWA domain-containing protein [Gemmatimonadales bacterium]